MAKHAPKLTPFAHVHDGARMKEKDSQPPVDKDEYAKRWGISTRKLDELIQDGLPVIKLGHRTLRILPLSADSYLVKKFGTGVRKAAVAVALLALTIGSALAQPGQTPYPSTDDSPIYLRAEKIWGPLPQGATTLQLLTAPLLSVQTNLISVLGADCGSWGRSQTVLSNTMRFGVYLPSWNQSALSITMLMSVCSNEPNDQIVFSLRAASIANNANLTSPVWSSYSYVTNTLSAANVISSVSFPAITPGNPGTTNSVVLLELGRVVDQFTNGLSIAQLGLSYAKNVTQ